jgi:hypothetical protein
MNFTERLVAPLSHQIAAVTGWLDKAQAFASDRPGGADALLKLRLAPDMLPLATQLRFLAFQSQEPVYRLRGQDVPEAVLEVRQEGRDGGERPGSWAEARARVAQTADFLASVRPGELDPAADAPLVHALPNGMVFDMTGELYVRDWALPQAAFHQMAAYALLRSAGVPLGKVDYVPHMFAYLRPGTAPSA